VSVELPARAVAALSAALAIVCCWLGATVLLNAVRRAWGVWLAGTCLVVAGAFFLWQGRLAGRGADGLATFALEWWPTIWLAGVALPAAWCCSMLWIGGWFGPTAPRWPLGLRLLWLATIVLGAVLAGALVVVTPFPHLRASATNTWATGRGLPGFQLEAVAYWAFALVAMAGAAWAAARPGHLRDEWAALAHRRARPWVLGATGTLAMASSALAWTVAWSGTYMSDPEMLAVSIARADLVTTVVVAAAVVLQGQAVVTYEIFTGLTLPRGALGRQWRWLLPIAAAYGLVGAATGAHGTDPGASVEAGAVGIAVLYALIGWRSHLERDALVERLRAFVLGQRFLERLAQPAQAQAPGEARCPAAFRALSNDVLDAQWACLVPASHLADMLGAVWVCPSDLVLPEGTRALALEELQRARTGQAPTRIAGPGAGGWAVTLGGPGIPSGVLILGAKRGGGLHSREDAEAARLVAEGLLQAEAGVVLARRLMDLQRTRWTQATVLAGRVRRLLHDDVLPEVHAAMLTVAGLRAGAEGVSVATQLAEVHALISGLLRDTPLGVPDLEKMGLLAALEVEVRRARGFFDDVSWSASEQARSRAKLIVEPAAEVLFCAAREAVRNAAAHGRGGDPRRKLSLTVSIDCDREFTVTIGDDGVGLRRDAEVTQDGPGAGQGLVLHSTMMAVVGGRMWIESGQDTGTRVTLALPVG